MEGLIALAAPAGLEIAGRAWLDDVRLAPAVAVGVLAMWLGRQVLVAQRRLQSRLAAAVAARLATAGHQVSGLVRAADKAAGRPGLWQRYPPVESVYRRRSGLSCLPGEESPGALHAALGGAGYCQHVHGCNTHRGSYLHGPGRETRTFCQRDLPECQPRRFRHDFRCG